MFDSIFIVFQTILFSRSLNSLRSDTSPSKKHCLKNYRTYSCFCVFVFMFSKSVFALEDVHLEDPTRPSDFVNTKTNPEDKVNPKGTFSLEAIVISDDYKVAIINEKILQVGDMIESKKVVSIDEEKVILSQEKNKDLVLKLSNVSVKEDSK